MKKWSSLGRFMQSLILLSESPHFPTGRLISGVIVEKNISTVRPAIRKEKNYLAKGRFGGHPRIYLGPCI